MDPATQPGLAPDPPELNFAPAPHELEEGIRCATCQATLGGPYCAHCGQPRLQRPIRLRELTRRTLGDLTDAEQGLLHTFLALSSRPATVVRDYLRGSTVPYASPGKYFLVTLAVVQLAAYLSGSVGEFAEGFTGGLRTEEAERVGELVDRFFVLFCAPSVLVLALVQRGLLKGGLNLAEHLVFSFYISAQQGLIWLPIVPFGAIANDAISSTAMLAGMLATTLYYLAAVRSFFRISPLQAVVRGLLTLSITLILSGLILAAVLGVIAGTG